VHPVDRMHWTRAFALGDPLCRAQGRQDVLTTKFSESYHGRTLTG